MKKILFLALVIPFLTIESLIAQESKVKTGWNFGPLPAISYNSDLGFQYGALCDIFYFGDGSTFPAYMHKFNVEVSRYTKGSGVYHFFYDSKHLIPKIRTTADISYLTDKMMDFYGFNGYRSPYFESMGASYYKIDRKLFRFTLDLQGRINDNFDWAAGIGIYRYKISPVRLEQYEGDMNLYTNYITAHIINEDEAEGGVAAELKLGVVNDSRDHEADPARGFFSEATVLASPRYLRFSLVHRGYIPVYREKLTFAYRAGWQGRLAGEIPFYMLQNISTLYMRQITNEGLGGLNSIRGVLRNRVVGDGVVWGNVELRYRFLNFNFLGQQWYLAVNPFIDAGRVVQYHNLEQMSIQIQDFVQYYAYDEPEKLHFSAGIGVKAIMNRNFVLSGEWGKPFNPKDGKNGINIGLNFIF